MFARQGKREARVQVEQDDAVCQFYAHAMLSACAHAKHTRAPHACPTCMPHMQMALVIGDELLLEEGAVRVHRLMIPLLVHGVSIRKLLHRVLSELHALLAAASGRAALGVLGAEALHMAAARAAAASAQWLLQFSPSLTPMYGSRLPAGMSAQPQSLDCALLGVLHKPATSANPCFGAESSAAVRGEPVQSELAVLQDSALLVRPLGVGMPRFVAECISDKYMYMTSCKMTLCVPLRHP
jgi:hypothetical protein